MSALALSSKIAISHEATKDFQLCSGKPDIEHLAWKVNVKHHINNFYHMHNIIIFTYTMYYRVTSFYVIIFLLYIFII